jgi:3-phenylpropionate/cinnamic acid dioxygenase small subunit
MDLPAVVRRLEVEDLYAAYAACLDADKLEAWPDFFIENCHYRVTSAENYAAGMRLGLIYATSRAMLHDRVSALREANIYEPQHYRHVISRIMPKGDGSAFDVEANFLVVRTMQDGDMSIFAAGLYVDRVVRAGDSGWQFASKIVVLDSRRIDTLLAIPL